MRGNAVPPNKWNRLPTELKLLPSTDSFCYDLKTFLFHSVYRHQDSAGARKIVLGGKL